MNSYLERLRIEIDGAVASATADSMQRAPAGKWNAAQILEHLFLTYKHTNRGIEKSMASGQPLATQPTLKHRLATLIVLNLGYIPTARKAPDRVVPKGISAEHVRQAFDVELQQMDSKLDACEWHFGAQTKIMDHPFLGPLTANEWRKFHWVHGRHHARQIRERLAH